MPANPSPVHSNRAGYWSPPVDRQIAFIGFDVLSFPYRRRITGIYILSKSDRYNYRLWSAIILDQSQQIEITSTDRLEEVLADKRLRWSNPS